MKKQRLPLNLGLVLLFVTSLIGAMSVRVNAGSSPSPGVTPDSSSAVGGAFSPATPAAPTTPAPGTGATVGAGGEVSVPAAVQASANSAAASITSNPPPAIAGILSGGSGSPAAVQAVAALANIGVPTGLAGALVEALAAAFGGSTSASATPGVLVASLKGITVDTKLAQNSTPNVDVNQLNNAINAYNQIIMESDAETLRKLAQNPEFVEIGRVLKELRVALNAG